MSTTPVTPLKLTADDLRHAMLEKFEQFKPSLQSYHDYAEQIAALSLEYHLARLAEGLPAAPVEELTLIGTLDARETPKSLDSKLAQLSGVGVKRVIFDRAKTTFYLFA